MKQKHIFIVQIIYDEDVNHISTEVIQGQIKRDVDSVYVIDNNGNEFWAAKDIFKKFDVVKKILTFLIGIKGVLYIIIQDSFWEDDADEHYVRYMTDEYQCRYKLHIIERMNELRNEIDRSIEKLIESQTYMKI